MRRLARDQSGLALGLAIMLVALVGVMAAGLLTFVATDLSAVIKSNRGQRALDMADAGVQIARRQLASDSDPEHYDGSGADEIQWSSSADTDCGEAGNRGLCLNDLDGSSATTDRVDVAIRSLSADSFEVISTGQYGDALRRIEAVFERRAVEGMRAYYTPGDIRLENNVKIGGVSFFAGRNIVQPNGSPGLFAEDYESFGPPLLIGGDADALGDWNVEPWNTTGRTRDGVPFARAGFAAEGYVCGDPSCDVSVADGVYGYDGTTGDRGNGLAFVGGADPPDGEGAISYPFPLGPPGGERLRELADEQGGYYAGASPPWRVLYREDGEDERVVFVDAGGADVTIGGIPEGRAEGVLAVRCAGAVTLGQEFEGVLLALRGEKAGCEKTRSEFRNEGQEIRGYVYADGGIELASGGSAFPLPPGREGLMELAFGPGSLELRSWRELFE